jgi:hypothetical protein
VWTHSIIHRDSLATKELCPELSEVKDTAISTVNYIQTRPLKIVTGFSEVAAIKTNHHSILSLENDLRATISKFQPRYYSLRSKRDYFRPTYPGMKGVFHFGSLN